MALPHIIYHAKHMITGSFWDCCQYQYLPAYAHAHAHTTPHKTRNTRFHRRLQFFKALRYMLYLKACVQSSKLFGKKKGQGLAKALQPQRAAKCKMSICLGIRYHPILFL